MPQFGADLVFNPGVEEDEQGYTAKQARTVDSPWHHVNEPLNPNETIPQPNVRNGNGDSFKALPEKMLTVLSTERAARRVHLSTQGTGPQPAIIVDGREGRAWIMLYNDGSLDVWIGETDSQLAVIPPLGWHLPAGSNLVLPTEDKIWAVCPSGNSNICIADGEN